MPKDRNNLPTNINDALDSFYKDRYDAASAYHTRAIKHIKENIKEEDKLARIIRERSDEQQKYLYKLDAEKAGLLKTIEARRKEKEYLESSLYTKKQMLDADIVEINNLKDSLEILKDKTTEKEKQAELDNQIAALQADLDKKKEHAAKMQKALQDAELKGVSIAQKRLILEERSKKYLEDKRKAQEQYYAEMQMAESDDEKKAAKDRYNSTVAGLSDTYGVNDVTANIFGVFLGKSSPIVNAITSAAATIANTTDKAVRDATKTYQEGLKTVDTRLQGLDNRLEYTGSYYEGMYTTVSSTFGATRYVSQQKILENLSAVVNAGIAYNVEQRAFLATVSDKIVSTFDVLDQNLTRLIRIQQADITTSQLGAEADLTRFFNYQFQDTSYLNQLYDSVQGAIIDATSQLSRDEATAFNYNVQKWLGSLYALGASDSLINAIAQGINYVGTGNVSALSGNEGLRNLFAMSASRADISFGEMLTGGLSAETTNDLLKAMVLYLQEIATSGNKVVQSAYGGVMGVGSLADLRAVRNLTASDIAAISGTNITYQTAMNVAEQGLLEGVIARTSRPEMWDNVINNILFQTGMGILGNETLYTTWKISDTASGLLGGGSSGIGKIVDTVANLAKAIVGGVSFISGITENVRSNLAVDNWGWGGNALGLNWSEYTSRGGEFLGVLPGTIASGVSYSGAASIGNPYGVTPYTLAQQANAVTATSQTVSGSDWTITRNIGDIYSELFEKQSTPIKVNLVSIADEAAEKLDSTLLTRSTNEELKSIRSRLDEEFDVDVRTDDVSAITSAISSIRVW